MRLKSTLTAIALVGVAASTIAAAGRAPSAADVSVAPPTDYIALSGSYSQPEFDDLITESFDVEMFDGETLYVEVTRPAADGQYPVVMEVSPYHGTIATRIGDRIFPDPKDDAGNNLGLTGWFAPRGYAVAIVDLRGTGRSTGCLDHLGRYDAKDLKTVIEWAADAAWSNGRVGLTGHSYVGSTPSVAAAQNPRGLATIAPSAGLASMYDHQFHNGVPWLLQYAGPIFAYEQLAVEREANENEGSGDPTQYGCGAPNSAATAGPGQATGMYEDWHAQRDWRDGAARADIPVFMIHGVNDNAARIPAAEWFFGDRAIRPDDKVWIGQWDHGSGGNTRCADAGSGGHPNCRFDQWKWALTAWFDKHLKGMDVDTGPQVEVFFDDEYATTTNGPWQRDGARQTRLFLDASDLTLSTEAPDATGMAAFAGSSVGLSNNVGQTLEFASAPFEEDVTFLGLPELELTISEAGQISHLVTILYRVDASGRRTPMNFCAVNTHLRNNVATPSPVTPGLPFDVRLKCFTMAHHVQAGESLLLEIGTSSEHHVPTTATDVFVVHTGGTSLGSYTLPEAESSQVHDDVWRFEQ